MVKVQVSTGYLEVQEGTAFPITFSVGEIRDISQRSGSFSKSLTFTGSKSNIEQFGHLYDVNIDDSSFNINTVTECSVIQNGITIVERAYLQLISVNKSEQSTNQNESITFTAVIKDTAGDLFTNINNKYLNEVDCSDMNHEFNAANVVDGFIQDVSFGYKYFLSYSPVTSIPVKEFRPAIFAKVYFDRIFARAGKSYTWSTLTDCRFDKLIIPYNGDGTVINVDAYKVVFDKSTSLSGTHTSGVININNITTLTSLTEVTDNANLLNPTGGQYSTPFYVSTGESININVNLSRVLTLTNPNANVVRPKITVNNGVTYQVTDANYWVRLRVLRNGVTNQTIILSQAQVTQLASGANTIYNDAVVANVALTGLNQGDIITFRLEVISPLSNGKVYRTSTNTAVAVTYAFTNDLTVTITPSQNNTGLFGTVDMNELIPKQIKQSDFVKSVLTMYNLFAIPDTDQPDNIILIHRDDYYDAGEVKDWSQKISNEREKVITFLPDLTKKKLQLSYKDDSDEANKAYKDFTNETYGQVEYTFDNEYIRDIERKELIFSPTPSAVTPFGAVAPMMSGSTPKNNIRILIDNGSQNLSQSITVVNYTGNSVTSSTYGQASHFENPLNPSYDINFGICDYYLYPIELPTANNLYNLYWRRTLAQLNTGKMLTAYFDLNEADIASLKLNDKIWCENAYWNINKVIDYNANDKQLTKVELISVDEGIRLAPFKIRTPKPSTALDFIPIRNNIGKQFYNNNNVVINGEVYGVTGKVVDDGTVYTKNLVAESINGVTLTETPVWKAVVSQSGTNAPIIERVLLNDYNLNIETEYVSTGTYRFKQIYVDDNLYLSTEDGDLLTTEDDFWLLDESDLVPLVSACIVEPHHNDNLIDGNHARLAEDGDDIKLLTYNGGVLSNDALPTDVKWVVTLTFYEK